MDFPSWVWLVAGVGGAFGLQRLGLWFWAPPVNPWPVLPKLRAGKTCQGCHHWSLDEGQETLRRHPAFLHAAAVLTPNQMVRAEVDGAGEPNAGRKLLPLAEDKWTYMGACLGHGELRHRTDGCPQHVPADSRAAQKLDIGEGPDFPEPGVQPAPVQTAEEVEAFDLSEVEIMERPALPDPPAYSPTTPAAPMEADPEDQEPDRG